MKCLIAGLMSVCRTEKYGKEYEMSDCGTDVRFCLFWNFGFPEATAGEDSGS